MSNIRKTNDPYPQGPPLLSVNAQGQLVVEQPKEETLQEKLAKAKKAKNNLQAKINAKKANPQNPTNGGKRRARKTRARKTRARKSRKNRRMTKRRR